MEICRRSEGGCDCGFCEAIVRPGPLDRTFAPELVPANDRLSGANLPRAELGAAPGCFSAALFRSQVVSRWSSQSAPSVGTSPAGQRLAAFGGKRRQSAGGEVIWASAITQLPFRAMTAYESGGNVPMRRLSHPAVMGVIRRGRVARRTDSPHRPFASLPRPPCLPKRPSSVVLSLAPATVPPPSARLDSLLSRQASPGTKNG